MKIITYKKRNIYDVLSSNLENLEIKNKIINNFIPIRYKSNFLLLTSLKDLDGNLLENNVNKIILKFNYKLYEIILKNIISFHDYEYFDFTKKYDAYIDSHTKLLFINFKSNDFEYYDITNLEFENLLNYNNENKLINYVYYKNNEKIKTYKFINLELKWFDKWFNLPPIPYFLDYNDDNTKKAGMPLYIKDELLGIISENNNNNIIITPIISIIRSLQYLDNKKINIFSFNTITIKLNLLKNKINYDYGLLVLDNENNSINEIKKKNIICSFNNLKINSEGNVIIQNNLNIPYKSYIWLLNENYVNIYILRTNYKLKEIIQNKEINDINISMKTKLNLINYIFYYINFSLSVDDINYIKIFNNYYIELNENLLFEFKDYLLNNNKIINELFKNQFSNKKIIIKININSKSLKFYSNDNIDKLINDKNQTSNLNINLIQDVINNFYNI